MKILNLKIFNPNDEEIRNIDFKRSGASVIYGKVDKPNDDTETTNSIGKTLLLRFIGYIFGRQEAKTDFSREIIGWKLKASVLYKEKIYTINRTLGDSKSIMIDDIPYSHKKYCEFFAISTGMVSKQILYSRRNGIVSSYAKNPSKYDVEHVLDLLNMDKILPIFNEIKKTQNKVKALDDYSSQFQDDIKQLEKDEFFLEQESMRIKNEIKSLEKKIETLNISEDSMKLIKLHTKENYQLKTLKNQYENTDIRIRNLKDLISEMDNADLQSQDVFRLYEKAQVDIPQMIVKSVEEVQKFYTEMFKDRKNTYLNDIKSYSKKNEVLNNEINALTKIVDKYAKIISENNLFKESMALYQIKSQELTEVESRYSMIRGSISNLSLKKTLEKEIIRKYDELEDDLKIYKKLVVEYRQYIYDLVSQTYGENNKAYFDISTSTSNQKIKAIPIVFELNLIGEFGEGISTVQNILMDLLIYYYNSQINFLIHDSSCFEGIDVRQLSTLISIIHSTAIDIDKQYIFSINEYLISKTNTKLSQIIKERSVITLTEEDTLLKFKF